MKLLKFQLPSAPAAPHSLSSASGGAAAAPSFATSAAAAAEDPDIVALSQALKALDFGTAATCMKFAKALEEQGILSLDKLKKMTSEKALKVLEKVKMTETQIDTVMEAIAPPPIPAAASATATVCAASETIVTIMVITMLINKNTNNNDGDNVHSNNHDE
jgi:hypothetical protein